MIHSLVYIPERDSLKKKDTSLQNEEEASSEVLER